ncbi:hypothetical protein D3C84_1003270 [compost metagenome]
MHGLDLDRLQQGLDAVAHITGMQGVLAREVVVQGADGHAGLQGNGAGGEALPAIALPNPNIGVEDRLHGDLRPRLSRTLERLGAALCARGFACHGFPNPSVSGTGYSHSPFVSPVQGVPR